MDGEVDDDDDFEREDGADDYYDYEDEDDIEREDKKEGKDQTD